MTTPEDRTEWRRELYVPSDFAATRPREASAGVHESPNVPAGSGAREAVYAEAIMGGKERAALLAVRNPGEVSNAYRDARAVMAVADAELAGLRGEVERLREALYAADEGRRTGPREAATLRRAEAAEAEAARLREAVEALADEANRLAITYWSQDSTYLTHATVWTDVAHRLSKALRAVLADAAPDPEQCPPGQEEAWSREFGPCPRCGATWPDLHVYSRPTGVLCVKCSWSDAAPDPTPNTGEQIRWKGGVVALNPDGTYTSVEDVPTGTYAASSVDDKAGEGK